MRLTGRLLEAIGAMSGGDDADELDRLGARALRYDVFPTVYHFRRRAGLPNPPAARDKWRQYVTRIALVRNELTRILEALGPEVPAILLKGEALGLQLFGDSYARATGDIDLLIGAEHFEDARRRLEALGYRSAEGAMLKTWAYNQFALYHERLPVTVELHWAIAFPQMPQPAPGELFESAVASPIGGEPTGPGSTVLTLSPEMLFLQLVYHFHQHEGFLKGLLDLAGWCDRFGASADLETIATRARDLGICGTIQWPLHALAELTGEPIPMLEPRIERPVRMWSDQTVRAARNCLIRPKVSLPDDTILLTISELGKVGGVLVESMAMLTLDGLRPKIVGFLKPWLWGPHRVGRLLYRTTRPLVAVQRRVRAQTALSEFER